MCTEDTSERFCRACQPDTCYNCTASQVYVDNSTIRCSHGCEYTFGEYTAQKIYTSILNDSPEETLTYAGPRVELIIPNGTPVTVHRDLPVASTIAEGNIVGTHCTQNADELCSNGVQYPPHDEATDRSDRYTNTIRHNAVWAWPYTSEYVSNRLTWDTSDHVFFEVAESDVVVSSYRFLDYVSTSDRAFTIPVEKYDSALTFTVDELRTAVREYHQPCSPSELLVDRS